MKWYRARFQANLDDCRPIKWPPPGPYWRTGQGEDYSVVVAYVKKFSEVSEYWPEAQWIEAETSDEITFTDRFPKPDWWEGGK